MALMQSSAIYRRSFKLSLLCAGMVFSISQGVAAESPFTSITQIAPDNLAQQQDLPALTGEVSAPALARVPDTLTIGQAVSRAVQ